MWKSIRDVIAAILLGIVVGSIALAVILLFAPEPVSPPAPDQPNVSPPEARVDTFIVELPAPPSPWGEALFCDQYEMPPEEYCYVPRVR